ncbi:hypothetical protein [Pseudothermotoga hypogea]|nr:hypothetical protein [Pseudothermotoga hypogea]
MLLFLQLYILHVDIFAITSTDQSLSNPSISFDRVPPFSEGYPV